jgi:hypothetical protein
VPGYDAVLRRYREELTEASILMPVGGLRCVDRLLALGEGRLLLFVADKGESHLSAFEGTWGWEAACHGGSFSFMANLHAIGWYVEQQGGCAFHSSDSRDDFRLAVFVSPGTGSAQWPALAGALEGPLEGFTFLDLLAFIEPEPDQPVTLDQILAYVKLSGYDPYVLASYADAVDEGLDGLDRGKREAVRRVILRCEDNDYDLGDHLDLPFVTGRQLYRMDFSEEAILRFERSLARTGPHEATFYNLGLCYEALGDCARARSWFERAVRIRSGYALARERLEMLGVEPTTLEARTAECIDERTEDPVQTPEGVW